ncbi:MAG: site-specific DNA-methyltransferase [Bacteroidetes bacterium]|nr:site-specific DNA-methyltransferase [Bacteroidota bacterium]
MAKRINKATKTTTQKPIEQYEHKDKQRVNNPPVGLVDAHTDNGGYKKKTYQYDPHLDPQLQWAGKAEHTSFDVPTVSLHVHERIDPRRIIETVKKEEEAPTQMSLFEEQKKPLREAIEFYKHKENWSNRLIAGDSLLVMNSLLEKEGMGGKVQMVYFDPPYGIRYGSNFQPFVNKRDVKDGKDDDLTTEPEMIKAFRDTWELGIHSYLTYLRDRLLLAKDLLHESGSIFVQISDENVHHVREILSEVFGSENFVSTIFFKTTGGFDTSTLSRVGDYLLWFAKDITKIKYRKLYEEYQPQVGEVGYNWIMFPDGTSRGLTADEKRNPSKIPRDGKVYKATSIKSQGATNSPQEFEFKGKKYYPGPSHHWKTSVEGLQRLAEKNRIHLAANSIQYIRYNDDFPYKQLTNIWLDTGTGSFGEDKKYVVETNQKVITKCLLMTTDPGDIALDITCGSGTTAIVAENWGRRWITCDTSRVALTLTKQRMMAANFNYFELAHPNEGVGSGFKYEKVPHIMLGTIANNEPTVYETLFDKPIVNNKKTRVTGPFTVEAVPAPVAKSFEEVEADAPIEADITVSRSGETLRQDEWRNELLRAGVRAKGGKLIEFTRVEPLSGTRFLQAEAETKEDNPKRVVVCFGPEHAPLEQRMVELALEEARTLKPKPEIILFCAFHFDSEARKDIEETNWPGITLLEAQMNADLLTDDLKKKRSSNESFWLIGQPDVQIKEIKSGDDKGKYTVEVNGFDYYNPKTGTVDSGGKGDIAMWMLDHDYDGRSLFPSQVFFPMAGAKEGWATLAKNLKAEIDEEKIEAFGGTVSLPFTAGKNVAVKIIDARGIESLKIIRL